MHVGKSSDKQRDKYTHQQHRGRYARACIGAPSALSAECTFVVYGCATIRTMHKSSDLRNTDHPRRVVSSFKRKTVSRCGDRERPERLMFRVSRFPLRNSGLETRNHDAMVSSVVRKNCSPRVGFFPVTRVTSRCASFPKWNVKNQTPVVSVLMKLGNDACGWKGNARSFDFAAQFASEPVRCAQDDKGRVLPASPGAAVADAVSRPYQPPTTNSQLPTTNSQLPTPASRLPTPDYLVYGPA